VSQVTPGLIDTELEIIKALLESESASCPLKPGVSRATDVSVALAHTGVHHSSLPPASHPLVAASARERAEQRARVQYHCVVERRKKKKLNYLDQI